MDKKVNSGFSYLALVVVIVVVLLAAAVGVFVYLNYSKTPSPQNLPAAAQNQPAAATTSAQTATSSGLGADIYKKTSNPLQNNLPSAPAVANPLQNVYQNPFQ